MIFILLLRQLFLHLVIFFILGTMTKTTKTDSGLFLASLTEGVGFSGTENAWSSYRQATDSGIFGEIYEARTGRVPSTLEVSRFREHFIDLLAQASSESAFEAMAGAPQLLSALTRSAEHRVSLATGAWS